MSQEKPNVDLERQLRYFQFDVRNLCNDFAESMEYWIKSGTDELQNNLIAAFPAEEENIKVQIGLLRDLYQIGAKEPLEKFKDKAKEIFTLPDNVILPGLIGDSVVSEEELEQLTLEVKKLEEKYVEEAYFNAELKNEAAKFKQLNPVKQQCEEILKNLRPKNHMEGKKPIPHLVKSAKTCEQTYMTNNTKENVMYSDIFKRQ